MAIKRTNLARGRGKGRKRPASPPPTLSPVRKRATPSSPPISSVNSKRKNQASYGRKETYRAGRNPFLDTDLVETVQTHPLRTMRPRRSGLQIKKPGAQQPKTPESNRDLLETSATQPPQTIPETKQPGYMYGCGVGCEEAEDDIPEIPLRHCLDISEAVLDKDEISPNTRLERRVSPGITPGRSTFFEGRDSRAGKRPVSAPRRIVMGQGARNSVRKVLPARQGNVPIHGTPQVGASDSVTRTLDFCDHGPSSGARRSSHHRDLSGSDGHSTRHPAYPSPLIPVQSSGTSPRAPTAPASRSGAFIGHTPPPAGTSSADTVVSRLRAIDASIANMSKTLGLTVEAANVISSVMALHQKSKDGKSI